MGKTPKLRTRQQLTVRYHQVQEELEFWKRTRTGCMILAALPVLDRLIARCEGSLEALKYALNDRVDDRG